MKTTESTLNKWYLRFLTFCLVFSRITCNPVEAWQLALAFSRLREMFTPEERRELAESLPQRK